MEIYLVFSSICTIFAGEIWKYSQGDSPRVI